MTRITATNAPSYPVITQADLDTYGAAQNPAHNITSDKARSVAVFLLFAGLPVADVCVNFSNPVGGPASMPIIPVSYLTGLGLNLNTRPLNFVMTSGMGEEIGGINSAAAYDRLTRKDGLGRPVYPIVGALTILASDFGMTMPEYKPTDYDPMAIESIRESAAAYLTQTWDRIQAGLTPVPPANYRLL